MSSVSLKGLVGGFRASGFEECRFGAKRGYKAVYHVKNQGISQARRFGFWRLIPVSEFSSGFTKPPMGLLAGRALQAQPLQSDLGKWTASCLGAAAKSARYLSDCHR